MTQIQREIHKHENVRVYSRKTFFILNGNLIFSNSVQWSRNILSTYHTRVNLYHTFSWRTRHYTWQNIWCSSISLACSKILVQCTTCSKRIFSCFFFFLSIFRITLSVNNHILIGMTQYRKKRNIQRVPAKSRLHMYIIFCILMWKYIPWIRADMNISILDSLVGKVFSSCMT